jgi:hypothetical protein
MKIYLYYFSLLSLIFTPLAFAIEKTNDSVCPPVVARLLEQGDPVKYLKQALIDDPKPICEGVMNGNFYKWAKEANVGNIKISTMISLCSGVDFQKANLKSTTQKAKANEVSHEQVKLRPVNFSVQPSSLKSEQQNLQNIQQAILENADILGKRKEYEVKLEKAEQKIARAKEHYDNLAVVIIIIREDVTQIRELHDFNKANQENDSEEYLVAIQKEPTIGFLKRNNSNGSVEQIEGAQKLLIEAKENLAAARRDLQAINEEMLKLTK